MIRAALIQISAFDIRQRTQALEHAVAMVHQAASQKPDLVLLPECTYPSYYLGDQNAPGTTYEELDNVMSTFADLARKYRLHLAVGLPERHSDRLYNSAFLFGPQGEVIGKVRKSFLWHFDTRWFSGGDDFPVFDTALGKIGMLVCADARLPEIPRMLKLGGAEIILDPTNWVSSGGDKTKLSNPQFEYMVQTRALENRVWFLAANKVGMERRSILFCGRSCIVAPSGERVAEASSDREEILVYDIDLELPGRDEIVPGFSCVADRRPEAYGLLTARCTGHSGQSATGGEISPWLAACVQSIEDHGAGSMDTVRKSSADGKVVCADAREVCTDDGVDCADDTTGPDSDGAEIISVLGAKLAIFSSLDAMKTNGIADPSRYAAEKEIALAVAQGGNGAVDGEERVGGDKKVDGNETVGRNESVCGSRHRSAILILPDGRCETYHKMHGKVRKNAPDSIYAGGYEQLVGTHTIPAFQTALGKVAFILDEEGLIPEPARIAALNGAELIIWISDRLYPLHEKVARTRAAENCCFLAACFPAERHLQSGNMLVAPNGTVLAMALPGESQIIAGMINPVLAHSKLIVPGTDVIAGRIPDKYARLSEL